MQQNTSVFQAALHIQLIKKSYYSFQLGGRKQKHSEAKKLFQEKNDKIPVDRLGAKLLPPTPAQLTD